MPGGFPYAPSLSNGKSIAFDGSNTRGTAVAPGAANTKGSWVELSSGLAADISLLTVMGLISPNLTTPNYYAVDIGIGAIGSEISLISNLMFHAASSWNYRFYQFPLSIPEGTRVVARCQALDVTSVDKNIYICLTGWANDWDGQEIDSYDTLGFVGASTKGTQLAGSGSSNTMGAYTVLTASSANDYAGLMLSADMSGVGGGGNDSYAFDVAVGGSGSEVDVISKIIMNKSDNVQMLLSAFMPIEIPAGSRITARGQSTDGTAANMADLIIYAGHK